MDVAKTLAEFQDYAAPTLDTYEQAIYLYLFRHTRLIGQSNVVVGLKSARKNMAMGIGERGKPMSEATCYDKLRSLEKKGFVHVMSSENKGTRVEVFLPAEINGLIPASEALREASLENMDFFTVPDNRKLIFEREGGKCCSATIKPAPQRQLDLHPDDN
jgi:DNA-binding HxlR family transcriptional regulator